jgi:hypothetical protein
MKRIFHSLLYSVLWIIAGVSLCYSTLFIGVYCNFFTWSSSLDWEIVLSVATTLVIEIFFFWLAQRTKGYIAGIISLLVTLALVAVGTMWFIDFYQETLCGDGNLFFKRRALSPEWFRVTFLALFLVPLILWGYYPFRRLIKSRKTEPPSSPSE